MQTVAVHGRPVFPNAWVLPDGAIAAAWHIAQDAVEEQLVSSLVDYPCLRTLREDCLLGRNLDRGENRCVMVCHHERRRRQPRGLVDQHVRPFMITVVGYEETGRE